MALVVLIALVLVVGVLAYATSRPGSRVKARCCHGGRWPPDDLTHDAN